MTKHLKLSRIDLTILFVYIILYCSDVIGNFAKKEVKIMGDFFLSQSAIKRSRDAKHEVCENILKEIKNKG